MNPSVMVDQAAGDVAAAESRNDGNAHMPEEFFGWLDRMEARPKGSAER
jgi:hypothetical protein